MEERFNLAVRISWWSVAGNIFLSIIKIMTGFWAGSWAMLSDGFHSFSDLLSTIGVLIGLHIARQPVDKTHPYGHGKAEAITAKFIGILLVAVGVAVAAGAINRLFSPALAVPGFAALLVALFSLLLKEVMFQYTFRAGKKTGSPALKADAWHHRSDAYSSLASLVGIAGARLGVPLLDPLAGLAVAFCIVHMGFKILKDSIDSLMDAALDESIIQELKEFASQVEGVEEVRMVKARSYCSYLLVEMSIAVAPELSIKEAHDISELVKDAILDQNKDILEVFVHVDPA